jgi:hypothetical protein
VPVCPDVECCAEEVHVGAHVCLGWLVRVCSTERRGLSYIVEEL